MTRQQMPWDDIPVPLVDINRRLAAVDMHAPASWAMDHEGRRLFVLELDGDHRYEYQKNFLTIKGIQIELRELQSGKQLLVLALDNEQFIDLFHVLCNSLLVELVESTSSASALETTFNHLRRWRAFLSGRNARVLSPEEVRGLFAEIWFFLELVHSSLGPSVAVAGWYGPERVQQDFIFSDRAVEIKSLIGADPNTVRISSENQLESLQSHLYLLIVFIKESQEESSQSLNQIIAEAQRIMAGSDVAFEFESKLAAFGYIPLQEYNHPKFTVVDKQSYEVNEQFPRITRSELQTGITSVRYQIELEQLTPFRCEYDLLFRGVS
jgi:hypothetical protein